MRYIIGALLLLLTCTPFLPPPQEIYLENGNDLYYLAKDVKIISIDTIPAFGSQRGMFLIKYRELPQSNKEQ